MKKAVYYGPKDVRVEKVEEPEPQAGQAKVKVKYCGLCGSDLHEYLHGPFPISPFGHEVCGEIVELGPEVEGFQVGDRVNAFQKDGYAEYMVAPQERLLKLPDSVSWERAAMLEPLAGAAYAIERGGVKSDDTVLIAGAGPVGLLVLLGVKLLGVETVYITDISESRRRIAKELGASAVFNPAELKIPPKMKELTGGQGVDVAIEAVGIEATLKDCLASTRYRGTVIIQGIFTEKVPVHMLGFVTREMTMIGTNSINSALALDWIENKGIEPEKIVTSIIPLDQISANGFEALAADKEKNIKILIEP
ncbi:MAG: zinc-binding dehydrogenase [Deltaproteobacteria bacterium]|nr:zinc-binding dehydrogenase [Deltaproteobacteria bacterium]MBW2052342.1 zinc-binding dehydrogenase [Deltaproteobacteria bacterium]MBW2142377.1 zinc-binding dehydrogenase [Deltaproteobacteria bacterium]MBW2324742.1 zinc-binding dehydrogenase [Deltaproteobacteria bacterium]